MIFSGVAQLSALPNLYSQYITAYEVCKVQVDKQKSEFQKLFAASFGATATSESLCK